VLHHQKLLTQLGQPGCIKLLEADCSEVVYALSTHPSEAQSTHAAKQYSLSDANEVSDLVTIVIMHPRPCQKWHRQ
jgi:hypothetical protein